MLSIKPEELIALKSLDTSTSHVTLRIPNWMLHIFQSQVDDITYGRITTRTEAILSRLNQNTKVEFSIYIGWIRLNNMEPRKQLERIQTIVSNSSIRRVLFEHDMLKVYKKPKSADDILYVVQFLKLQFHKELSNSFINN